VGALTAGDDVDVQGSLTAAFDDPVGRLAEHGEVGGHQLG